MVAQLLYVSAATPAITDGEFQKIDAAASIYNALNAITGLLCYDGNRFVQLIEGRAAAIDVLYAKILADRRHRDLTVLHHDEARIRAFGEWAMRCVRVAPAVVEKTDAIERLLTPSLKQPLRSLMLSFGERAES